MLLILWVLSVSVAWGINHADYYTLNNELVGVRVEQRATHTLVIFDDALFGTDEYHLDERSKRLADSVSKVLSEKLPTRWLYVEGHTDNEGSTEYNQKLSELRAIAITSRIAKAGYQLDRVDAIGYGFQYPLCNNSTAAGRACNRRVQIAVFKRQKK